MCCYTQHANSVSFIYSKQIEGYIQQERQYKNIESHNETIERRGPRIVAMRVQTQLMACWFPDYIEAYRRADASLESFVFKSIHDYKKKYTCTHKGKSFPKTYYIIIFKPLCKEKTFSL